MCVRARVYALANTHAHTQKYKIGLFFLSPECLKGICTYTCDFFFVKFSPRMPEGVLGPIVGYIDEGALVMLLFALFGHSSRDFLTST